MVRYLAGLMSRKADNDILLKDVPILKDARVRYSFVGFHMNEDYYKNPL
jgi:cytochrome P450